VERRRVALTDGELAVVGFLLLYGLGALLFTAFGTGFLLWTLVLALLAWVPVRVALRRQRERRERARRARRAARVAAYRPLADDWPDEGPLRNGRTTRATSSG
jgi:hypothetical protein